MATTATIVTDQHIRQRLTQRRVSWNRDSITAPKPTSDDIAYGHSLTRDPCSYCGESAGMIDHIDHQQHGWQNLTATCHRCNVGKGERTLLKHLLAVQVRSQFADLQQQLHLLRCPRSRQNG